MNDVLTWALAIGIVAVSMSISVSSIVFVFRFTRQKHNRQLERPVNVGDDVAGSFQRQLSELRSVKFGRPMGTEHFPRRTKD